MFFGETKLYLAFPSQAARVDFLRRTSCLPHQAEWGWALLVEGTRQRLKETLLAMLQLFKIWKLKRSSFAIMDTCVLPKPRLVTRESKLCCSCLALCSRQHLEQRPDQAGLPKNPQPDLHNSSDFSTFSLLCSCSGPAAILLGLTSETAVEAVETRI